MLHRLTADGHDVEHVDTVSWLGKGTSDETIARYSLDADRTIVTHDDFVEDVPPNRYRAALFFADDTVSATEVADIIDRMSRLYPHEEVVGLQKTGREWL